MISLFDEEVCLTRLVFQSVVLCCISFAASIGNVNRIKYYVCGQEEDSNILRQVETIFDNTDAHISLLNYLFKEGWLVDFYSFPNILHLHPEWNVWVW